MANYGAHRRGQHGQRHAKAVVDRANNDPTTRCWRCGKTLDEHAPHKDGTRPTWQAGHTRDGDPTCQLLPEASTCNTAAGAIARNRRNRNLQPTRNWYA